METDLQARFWDRLIRTPSGCWEWPGKRHPIYGYGFVVVDRREVRAHRLAFELTAGAVPHGLMVCHRCDNRACCNPSHLYAGTHADNMRDMVSRNRQARGTAHGMSKLTPEAALAIRDRRDAGEPLRRLADEFGVSQQLVCDISKRRRWAWL